jgi:hypothetical protein
VTTATPWPLLGVSSGVRDVHISCGERFVFKLERQSRSGGHPERRDRSGDNCRAPDARAEMASRYVDDDLPEAFERLLDRAMAAAVSQDDAAFIVRYRTALAAYLCAVGGSYWINTRISNRWKFKT